MKSVKRTLFALAGALSLAPSAHADSLSIAQYPLFLTSRTPPNILVIYDNSESMDGTMAGKLIAGDDLTTRGNIARTVIRNTINAFSSQFNWGLESFGIGGAGLYSTYPYWLGNEQTMVFTDDCVNGISASNGGLRCIANPQPFTGGNYVTYDRASDDPDINDVLYIGYFGAGAWATSAGGGNYHFYFGHDATTDFEGGMNSYWTDLSFTPTDAGYIPFNPPISRQLYAYRAWGFYAGVTGTGTISEPVLSSSSSGHLDNLQSLLATETQYGPDLKNAAVFTPLAGSMATARQYFGNQLANYGLPTPISLTCQKSFILLATDGNPTSDMNGNMYPLWQQANTYQPATQSWTFSQAARDVFDQVTPLRNLPVNGATADVQTYVVGLGDTLANPASIATLNQIANLGGTNQAYLAGDAGSLATAFQAISIDITSKTAAASAVSLNTGSWGTGTHLYQARFNSGDWSGQLISYTVNADGTLGSQLWDSGQAINSQNWSSGRKVLSYKPSASLGSRGVPFRWPSNAAAPTASELDAAQTTQLNLDATGNPDGYGADRVKWIRGFAGNEAASCGTCTPSFRSRPTSKLGDIIHSAPNYVAAPAFNYPDSIASQPYSAFAASNAGRNPTIYVGANDGMLHAFDANSGTETLAYLPSFVFRNLGQLTTQSRASGSERTSHRYFVDGSPTVSDVNYGSAWHTLLVGGLSGGGKGVYALDVTDPSTFSEANASSIVRWEFSDSEDVDLGYMFGQPLLVKTNNGRWSVIIGNGYNSNENQGHGSGAGHAVLFVLDAETGAVVKKIDTNSGSSATPNGLSGPIGVDTTGDGTVDVVYAGDLFGNMWKFDLTSGSASGWGVGLGGSPLYRTGGQPITVRPDVTKYPSGGYLVTFGTGSYIDTNDGGTTSTQAFYGIRDMGVAVAGVASLVQQSVVGTAGGTDSNTYRITTHAVGAPTIDTALSGDNRISLSDYNANKKGWYLNLPTSGERAVTEPAIRAGRVVFNTLIPNTDPCSFGGSGWVMEVDVLTGNRYDSPTFDTNGDRSMSAGDLVTYGSGTENTSGRMTASIPASAGFLRMQPRQPAFENKYVNTSSGSVTVIGETAGSGGEGRVSWRQVQ